MFPSTGTPIDGTSCAGQSCLMYFLLSVDASQGLLETVRRELEGEPEVTERQLQLLSSITSDVSEPTKQLLMKLNCSPKCELFFS